MTRDARPLSERLAGPPENARGYVREAYIELAALLRDANAEIQRLQPVCSPHDDPPGRRSVEDQSHLRAHVAARILSGLLADPDAGGDLVKAAVRYADELLWHLEPSPVRAVQAVQAVQAVPISECPSEWRDGRLLSVFIKGEVWDYGRFERVRGLGECWVVPGQQPLFDDEITHVAPLPSTDPVPVPKVEGEDR